MLQLTFLSDTNPPIHEKIPPDVFFESPSEGSRTSGKPASLRLSGTLAESTLSDKTKGAGEMVVRFPTIRRLSITGSAFSRELRANSP